MIKLITQDELPIDMLKVFNYWHGHFSECMEKSLFNPYLEYQGEDRNLISWRSKEDYIRWWGQPPGNEPYRDDGFYTRELTWLSKWCKPNIVVEIGTDKGMGTFLLDRLAPHAEIYTIDIAEYASLLPDKQVEIGFFSKLNNCIVYYRKEKPNINPNLIFIDGDHSETAVWEDSIWAWQHINRFYRWAIIWHDFRQDGKHDGLLRAVNRFSNYARKKIYKFADSSTVWMSAETNEK